mgnify:CR=1 FL=1
MSDPASTKPKNVSDLLARPVDGVVEGFIGIASTDRNELILSGGHVLQRMRDIGRAHF